MSRGEQPVAVRWNRGVETALILLLVAALLGAGLFVWKRKSDRAACILNIRNVQQAVRAYQGTRQVIEGSPMDWTKIMGPGGLLRRTYCPCGGIYPKEENGDLAEWPQMTQTQRHGCSGGSDFGSPCG